MESYFKEIKKKIRDKIVFEEFEIIDNSKFHRAYVFNPKISPQVKNQVKLFKNT